MKQQYLNEKAARHAGVKPGRYRIGGQKVQLVWKELKLPQGNSWRCQQWPEEPDMGLKNRTYMIAEQQDQFALILAKGKSATTLGEFGSLDDAKRAAQADHEAH
ncbi:MAG: hypothetical protein AAFZ46_19400 [Pseudomonadota bacterium]